MKCERLAISLLRGGQVAKADAATLAAFARLRQLATRTGLTIAPQNSPFVGEDEAHLLGWLALLQRQVALTNAGLPAALRPAIGDCAARLEQVAVKLEFRSVARCPSRGERHWIVLNIHSSQWSARTGMSKQAQLIELLRGRGETAVADLARLGFSRTLICKMAKRGQINRLRFGVYAIP